MAITLTGDSFMGSTTDTYNRNHKLRIDFTNKTVRIETAKYLSKEARGLSVDNCIYKKTTLALTDEQINSINAIIYGVEMELNDNAVES